ncbi:MAG: hypothetical protein SGARI_005414 [Bacillariaceae sp.]
MVPEASTAALCHKALFGVVQLEKVLNWAKYHHALGFDHIFIWYQPSIVNYTGFEELSNQTFVSMMPTPQGREVRQGSRSRYVRLKGKGAVQRDVEKVCLRQTAKNYSYVMVADADEYLWFNESVGLKQFIDANSQYDYMSFGKYQYDLLHTIGLDNETGGTDGYGLSQFPFTAGTYCRQEGEPVCPGAKFC